MGAEAETAEVVLVALTRVSVTREREAASMCVGRWAGG